MVKQYYPNELYHYGVKGMKWGVRRYQNYDGTRTKLGQKRANFRKQYNDHTLKKGKELYRIANSNEPIDSKRKWVTSDADTRDDYEDIYEQLELDPEKPVSTYTYNTRRDLNVAGIKTVVDELNNKYGDIKLKDVDYRYESTKKKVDKILSEASLGDYPVSYILSLHKTYAEDNSLLTESLSDNITKGQYLAERTVKTLAWKEFVSGKNSDVIAKLRNKGYDALVDIEDFTITGGFNGSSIIINPKETINLKQENKWSRRDI